MQFQLAISHPDGDTHYTIQSTGIYELKRFLSETDREGSYISLIINAWNEDVYQILNKLEEEKG